MKTLAFAAVALLLGAPGVDKPFVAGGSIVMQLASGEYEVVPAPDNHIRVTLSGNVGSTKTDVVITGQQAGITVSNTPSQGNFHAKIEIPKSADLKVSFTAGDLTVGPITGNKNIEATAGDVKIDVGNADDYGSVDAAVRVGDLAAGPFGGKKQSFIGQNLTWTGKGKYRLHAKLGVGDLKLR
jgi:hypothetical protein